MVYQVEWPKVTSPLARGVRSRATRKRAGRATANAGCCLHQCIARFILGMNCRGEACLAPASYSPALRYLRFQPGVEWIDAGSSGILSVNLPFAWIIHDVLADYLQLIIVANYMIDEAALPAGPSAFT